MFDPFVQWLGIPGVMFRVDDGFLRLIGSAPMVTLQGIFDSTSGAFLLSGSGTVAGYSNIPIQAICVLNQDGTMTCTITIGGSGASPPLNVPIVYQFVLDLGL